MQGKSGKGVKCGSVLEHRVLPKAREEIKDTNLADGPQRLAACPQSIEEGRGGSQDEERKKLAKRLLTMSEEELNENSPFSDVATSMNVILVFCSSVNWCISLASMR